MLFLSKTEHQPVTVMPTVSSKETGLWTSVFLMQYQSNSSIRAGSWSRTHFPFCLYIIPVNDIFYRQCSLEEKYYTVLVSGLCICKTSQAEREVEYFSICLVLLHGYRGKKALVNERCCISFTRSSADFSDSLLRRSEVVFENACTPDNGVSKLLAS